MKIVFQNENFVAVDKDANVLTVPSRTGDKDPRPCLGLDLQKKLKLQIYPVHRLDYEVSGLVLYALNPRAHKLANQWFEHKHVAKKYQAITEFQDTPPVANQEYEWKCKILRGKKRAYESPVGKPAVTRAKVVQVLAQQIFWELNPITGRSHQLRFDLFRHGYPILGDTLYGSKQACSQAGIALKSYEIIFLKEKEAKDLGLPLRLVVSGLYE